MEYHTLGRTGIRVSTYALGTMMFSADGNPDEKEFIGVVHAALDAGVNLIDTADTYSHRQAEEIVGKAIAGHRDENVLSSKVRLRAGAVIRLFAQMCLQASSAVARSAYDQPAAANIDELDAAEGKGLASASPLGATYESLGERREPRDWSSGLLANHRGRTREG